ncbi:MAG: amidohydrolase [Actinobacteria bacterium]|nr:amidohydrolase [Actinomycetota bacterium]
MIIDVHTHIWPKNELTPFYIEYFKSRNLWDKSLTVVTAERLLKVMDSNDIELSIVSSVSLEFGMGNEKLERINLYVSEEIKKYPDRFIGFCTVDPFGGKLSIDLLRKSIENLGFLGLKLHPSIQEFYPNDKRIYPIYEIMQDYKLPILLHTGSIGIKPFKDSFSNPQYIDEIACDFPDLSIIVGHSGKIWHDEAVMLLRKHKNIFMDISTNIGRSYEYRSKPMEWFLYKAKIWAGDLDRVLFGSDYPLYFQKETLEVLNESIRSLNKMKKDFITDEDIKKINYLNAKYLISTFKS